MNGFEGNWSGGGTAHNPTLEGNPVMGNPSGVMAQEVPIPGQNRLRQLFQQAYGATTFVEVEDYNTGIPHICPLFKGIRLLQHQDWVIVVPPQTQNQVPAQISLPASVCMDCGKVIHPNWS